MLVPDGAARFLADMRDQFDWVVVDTPPVLLFPDAGLFAGMLDTCVMVAGAASTPSTTAATAVTIGPSRIIGVVLNRADSSEIAEGYGWSADTGRSARGKGRVSADQSLMARHVHPNPTLARAAHR